MGTTFTRMDRSTAAEWQRIAEETARNQPRVAERVIKMLRSLTTVVDGFAVDQLTHSLQTATRAARDGADDQLVVACLCHDIGKAISVANHPAIAAEILRPYVRDELYWLVRVHQDFQGTHYYRHLGRDPHSRERHRRHPSYALAEHFADAWDQVAFDPRCDTLPLTHFEPLVRAVFRTPAAWACGEPEG
jgi:predicted HD phosphohydrolase